MADPILIGIGLGLVAGIAGVFALVFRRRGAAKTEPAPRPAVRPEGAGLPPSPHTPAEPALPGPAPVEAAPVAPAPAEPALPGPAPVSATPPPRPADEAPPSAEPLPYAAGLVASVELWVGDTRVVVKDGTRTQQQFRSYADSLLSALKEAKDETR